MKPSVLAAALLPLPLMAQNETDHPYTKANIAPVTFVYEDAATDGCWTNPGDSPALAYAALQAAGIAVTDDPAMATTTLRLFIDAQREAGGCYGNMTLDLRGPAHWAGEPVQVVLRDAGGSFIGHQVVNDVVPVIIDHFVGGELAGFPEK